MDLTSILSTIVIFLLLTTECLCYDCCSTHQGDNGSLKVICRTITTPTAFGCLSMYLFNLSSTGQSLDIQISNCYASLFPNDYFQRFNMAGLKMEKCGLTKIPSRIYGLSCSSMTNEMSLMQNSISTIDANAFCYCTGLKSLDLSYNHLSSIKNGDFQYVKSLTTLILSQNVIERVQEFSNPSKITQLYLDNNVITYISANAFQGMTDLKKLFLQNNSLASLTEGIFDNFQLTNLSLNGNPFVCNCSLLWLQNWLQVRPYLTAGAQCYTPVVGPVESTPFCVSTTVTTIPPFPSTSSSYLTTTSTRFTSLSTPTSSSTEGLTTRSTPSPTSSTESSTTSSTSSTESLTTTLSSISSTSSIFPSTSFPNLTSTFLETSSDSLTTSSIVPTFVSTFTTSSSANGDSTSDGGDSYIDIVSNFIISSDLILSWSTNESKVMILYGPIKANSYCSGSLIVDIFGNMSAGVHTVVVANRTEYQIPLDDFNNSDQLSLLVCITNAQLDINLKNVHCSTSCLTTSSPSPTPTPTSASPSTILLSVAIGIICAIVFIFLIVIMGLLSVLRCTSKKKKGKVNILSTEKLTTRPLPFKPTNESTQGNKFPSERNGLPNPMYEQGSNIGDKGSYLYLEPSIPEECDIDEPINSETYDRISRKDSDSKEPNDRTAEVSFDSPSDGF